MWRQPYLGRMSKIRRELKFTGRVRGDAGRETRRSLSADESKVGDPWLLRTLGLFTKTKVCWYKRRVVNTEWIYGKLVYNLDYVDDITYETKEKKKTVMIWEIEFDRLKLREREGGRWSNTEHFLKKFYTYVDTDVASYLYPCIFI